MVSKFDAENYNSMNSCVLFSSLENCNKQIVCLIGELSQYLLISAYMYGSTIQDVTEYFLKTFSSCRGSNRTTLG